MKRGIQWLLVAGACLVALGCSRQDSPPPSARKIDPADSSVPGMVRIPADSPKLRQIRVEPVMVADMPGEEIVAPGRVEVNPNRVSRLLLPVPGRVTKVMAKLGDHVSEGDPLIELESPDADAAMSAYLQADGGVTQAKASMVKAQGDHDRAVDLYEHRAIAQKEVLSAESILTQAKAGVEQAEAQQQQALRKLQLLGIKPGVFGQKVTVRAPSSGKVLEMNVAPGEYRNDTSAPLMTIADLSSVWFSANVPENQIRLVDVGGHVDITLLAFPGVLFSGRVRRLADTVDAQTRTVKVLAELDNPSGRLRPEMYGEIRYVASFRQMPAVPTGAVIQSDEGPSVFIERSSGEFQRVTVTVGRRSGNLLPILSGVSPGDRVVVDGVMLLKGI